MSFPARSLTSPKTFILEVGTDGFNAYAVDTAGSRELFAASSSSVTFLKVMEQIVNSNGNAPMRFAIVGGAVAVAGAVS
jgi:hypothetical protein